MGLVSIGGLYVSSNQAILHYIDEKDSEDIPELKVGHYYIARNITEQLADIYTLDNVLISTLATGRFEAVTCKQLLETYTEVALKHPHLFSYGSPSSTHKEVYKIAVGPNGLFTLNQQLYYRLVEDLRNSRKVEVFAGFEPMHPDDELPGFSYGVKLYLNDGTEKNHIFDSSGDGCLMSDVANDSRKRTLNSVISMIDMTIHRIFPKILEDKKLECVIRCDMEIIGFTCPDIFKIIKNDSEVTREDYSGRDVIPQNYLGIKIAGNMVYSTKVEVFEEIEEIEHLSFFGLRFYTYYRGVITFNLERDNCNNINDVEMAKRRINKIIAYVDQLYF